MKFEENGKSFWYNFASNQRKFSPPPTVRADPSLLESYSSAPLLLDYSFDGLPCRTKQVHESLREESKPHRPLVQKMQNFIQIFMFIFSTKCY